MNTSMKRRRAAGLTLVELMIAMVLGLIIIAAAGSLYLGGTRSYRQDERVSAMSDELRIALRELNRELEMAAHWGPVINPGTLTVHATFTDAVTDCASPGNPVFLDTGVAIQFINDASGAAIQAMFSCVTDARSGTGAIAINRVSSRRLALADLVPGRPYLQTSGTNGALFAADDAGQPPPANQMLGVAADACDYWEYTPSLWYIRDSMFANRMSDGVPNLCPKVLVPGAGGTLRMQTDPAGCVAVGIEDLHVELGVEFGLPPATRYQFTSTPTAAEMASPAMLRAHLLGRSHRADFSYRNEKTFVLGDKVIDPVNDNFYRRTASTTVVLRNPTAQRAWQ
jgi:type IV pilus assembly protein PilW